MVLNVQMYIKRNALFVRLDGELDQSTVDSLKIRVVELIEKYQVLYLIFNFSKLKFMDSSGIGFIIGRYNFLKKFRGQVILCDMNDHIKRIVTLSGLNKICIIKSNEEEANSYLGVA